MLFDIDKSSDDRVSPSPNTHDVLAHKTVMAKATNSINYITPATNRNIIAPAKNGQFTIVNSGTFSFNPPGITGVVNGFASQTTLLTSIPHGLSFIPGVKCYLLNPAFDGFEYNESPLLFFAALNNHAGWDQIYTTVDQTNFNIYLDSISFNTSLTVSDTYTIAYYLLQQTSN